jgi:hypothetical protein
MAGVCRVSQVDASLVAALSVYAGFDLNYSRSPDWPGEDGRAAPARSGAAPRSGALDVAGVCAANHEGGFEACPGHGRVGYR